MRKIQNPFASQSGYNCYACCPTNSSGLQLEFYEDEESVSTFWLPGDQYMGWSNIIHGGVQSTILDELANWFVLIKQQTAGMTLEINLKYKKPLKKSAKEISGRATLNRLVRNVAIVNVELMDGDNNICTEGTIKCYMMPQKEAIEKGMYPD